MGREEFAETGSGGRSSGRADDHCKTSDDMLPPRHPDMGFLSTAVRILFHDTVDNAEPAPTLPGRRPRRIGSVVDTGFDGEHRTGGVEQDALGIRAQDELAHRSAPAQADDDEVSVHLVGHLDQIL